MRCLRNLCWLAFALLVADFSGFTQSPPQRPGLIRDTEPAGKGEDETTKAREFSPLQAENCVKVGNFYFKKKNYQAAIERYLEALDYQPNRMEAYEALGRAYEKIGDPVKAIKIYQDFVEKNPTSPKVPEFRSKLAKLGKKSQ